MNDKGTYLAEFEIQERLNKVTKGDSIIEDKLKTTVNAGLTKLLVWRIRLSKIFKWWK